MSIAKLKSRLVGLVSPGKEGGEYEASFLCYLSNIGGGTLHTATYDRMVQRIPSPPCVSVWKRGFLQNTGIVVTMLLC